MARGQAVRYTTHPQKEEVSYLLAAFGGLARCGLRVSFVKKVGESFLRMRSMSFVRKKVWRKILGLWREFSSNTF